MGSRPEFTAELASRRFVQTEADVETWKGSIRIPNTSGALFDRTHLITLPVGFPFWPPKVCPEPVLHGPQWHMEPDGHLCLYPSGAWPAPPWDDVDALFAKVAGWYEQHHAGWPDDPGDLDLERYFKKTTHNVLVVFDDMEPLLGNRLRIEDAGKATYLARRQRGLLVNSKSHEKRDRRDEGKGKFWAAGVDLGVLTKPVNDWKTLSKRLDDQTRDELLRLSRNHTHGFLVAKYTRRFRDGPKAGSVALKVDRPAQGTATPTLTALEVENRVAATSNRRGPAQDLLRDKSVAIVGCGAVGSFLADELARAGIGRLTLVDWERLRFGNCVRHLADRRYVNIYKAEAVKQVIVERGLMPPDQITAKIQPAVPETAPELFEQHDLVVDATADSKVFTLFDYLGENLRRLWISVALHRGGNVVRVDRLGVGTPSWTARLPGVKEPEEIGTMEAGCGDPVSPTPASSVTAAASLACRMVVDTLRPRTRRVLPHSAVETLLPHDGDGYAHLGVYVQ
jgi:ThiF family protein